MRIAHVSTMPPRELSANDLKEQLPPNNSSNLNSVETYRVCGATHEIGGKVWVEPPQITIINYTVQNRN